MHQSAELELPLDPYVEFDCDPPVRVYVELAATPEQRARGLTFRQSLAPDHGMLFVFPAEVRNAFWGRDTLISLSVGLISSLGTLQEIIDLPAGDVRPRQPGKAYQYALEVNRGWFGDHQVEVGRAMRFVSGAGPIRVS